MGDLYEVPASKNKMRALIIWAVVAALFTFGVHEHGYQAGRDAEIKAADKRIDRLSNQYQNEKEVINNEAQKRIAASDAGAINARRESDRLRSEIATVRRVTLDHSSAVGVRDDGRETAVLLADVLDKSVRRNEELARFADRAWDVATTCNREYNALRKPK